ncbi:triose-phosphate transporter family protein [Hirsutella rhossiliensis]|uniref:Triose-phosphate transporter family domain-containing protein n=1 Tax=Hirsutella rhossiliensis TaxID=111463 RepID=A0A9P8SJE2_9HYPO|nr:triose-phosphate transporter family domain-containing protein [Hirsutella rhossiliensis]KAH0965208.1 triose-phosphate transporter family domain-containing protein [Hirsutella rhossiliensis]
MSSKSPASSPALSHSSTATFVVADEEAAVGKLAPMSPPSKGLHPVLHIATWIFFSNITILFNKWILDTAGFRYPVLLTCWHLVFSAMATQILSRTTSLLDSRHRIPMTPRLYLRTICPIGLFYSGSLVCSNLVYLYLSVAFIQMLKSAAPVAVLFASWAWGVADPSLASFLNILVIVAGVALASFGEIQFSLIGFLYQIGGIAFEAVRIVMIQVMLSVEGLRMDPLVGLYYYAPVCAAMNLLVALFTEIPRFHWDDLTRVGFGLLFVNALVAFLLNIASVFLIGKTSGLVMTLTGIFKNILLIVVSIVIWQTEITLLQGVGYTIALAGLTYYSVGHDQLARSAHAALAYAAAAVSPSSSSALQVRRIVLLAIFALSSLLVIMLTMRRYDARTVYSPPTVIGTE